MPSWVVKEKVRDIFPDLLAAERTPGEEINANWMSRLVRCQEGDNYYYIKTYTRRGRWLRRFIGRSRIRAEWENLQAFVTMGLPTAELVAYGESGWGEDYRGTLITKEVAGTLDLASLALNRHSSLADRQWRLQIIDGLSTAVRKMHGFRFVHNDLKWRNLLVDLTDSPTVYFIDCPLGRKMPGPFLVRGRIKDLACLDKIAKKHLSQIERLRFYLAYKGETRLSAKHKREIHRVLCFFDGRE